ncbi:TetR/AcrR family transcriptional regulator [Rhodococcus sp. 15-2388-1-1a]|uniref:TetR/AcrR family transcriptional regulator n=1 Tax=Nocardiaceae TaxID=85025 RepID=UPI0009E94420|nr:MULTISPECIES: TetR/AcrR family transcriptional regulator [Rhodococcus]OZE99790.1 TetR/AcrR family transcriptional regulator [Rhodococcus sp. 15-2388-1-1a]
MRETSSKEGSAHARMRRDTHARLIQAGGRALAQGGLDGVKTASVARDAGVANGTFYLHFDDRDALVAAVVGQAVEELARALWEVRQDDSSLSATDRRAVDAIVSCAEQNRDLFVGAMRASSLLAGADPFDALLEQRRLELVAARTSTTSTVDPDQRATVRAEFAMLTGTLSWWLTEDTGVSRDSLIDTLVAIIGAVGGA